MSLYRLFLENIMNNKVNYTVIGFLVLFSVVLILAFSYWLLQPTVETKTSKYNIYFDESVLGLNIDAPVKYRGISVGKVTKLQISPTNSAQVEVEVTILSTTPVKENTAAKLTSQGITGLSYINLSMGDHNAPPLVAKAGQKYPVIKTIPSFFEDFEKSLDNVSSKLSKTLTRTETLLNDENQKQITLLLTRSANVMDKIDRVLNDDTIQSLQASAKNFESASAKIDAMIPNINKLVQKSSTWEDSLRKSFEQIENTYVSISKTMDGMRDTFSSTGQDVSEIIPTLDATMLEMQNVMVDLKNTMDDFSKSPSDVLYKEEEIKKAPGEK
jgi:phospholipid/cholesterol/gamma-HCH transport system substrate-binding protein